MIAKGKCMVNRSARQRGFTLIELVIAIVIVAILVLLALPSFRETAIRNNVTSLNNNLLHALNVARAEAVRRGVRVEVASASGGASWVSGWSIKVDSAGDGTFATTINQQQTVPAGYSVCGKSSGGGSDGAVVFTALGALGANANQYDLNVNRPDGNAVLGQRLTIGSSGQVSVKQNTTSSPAAGSCT